MTVKFLHTQRKIEHGQFKISQEKLQGLIASNLHVLEIIANPPHTLRLYFYENFRLTNCVGQLQFKEGQSGNH